MRLAIGLTGGIAMGKTTVSQYLADRYQLPILDADLYAREAVAVGSPVLTQIADRYAGILQADGSLDRSKLGSIVFQQPAEKQWLEAQIHPFVRDRLQSERNRYQQADPQRPVVVVVPLLFEAEMTDLVDQIWVIYCPREHQLRQLMQRDQLTPEQATARIASQMPIEQKCDRADVVLSNSSTTAALLRQVDRAIAGKLGSGTG
ncbi:dephospho-CoA kinase [filamentous cyanobacterium LEGE 11480]|uniref:Dephospho-CoA kinase n=1 Tax=Romeriopsis navalis LEGE 11480 TaxID=2777977 RepID=A0A928Z643_9CYAN|nr:dephospho-CoA kinase [Romeriopsis navalis]MBE9031895.1 dephospho-CoA kinase [Romeriopsis navalis LEGE 11480]